MILTDPPCGTQHPPCTCKQTWPTIIVSTAHGNSIWPARGVVALQIGSNRYHLDADGAAALFADLKATGHMGKP